MTDVVIRVGPSQAKYFRSLPKHCSQKELAPVDGWPVFTYHISPTYDFKQEILSYGADVEMLAPDCFRDEIRENITEMASHYGLVANISGNNEIPYLNEKDEPFL